MQTTVLQQEIHDRVENQWRQLVASACAHGQVNPAQVLRCEGSLQLALDAGVIDAALLQNWSDSAQLEFAQTISNDLWSAPLQVGEDKTITICFLQKRAPVYATTR